MFDRRIIRGTTFTAPSPLIDGDQSRVLKQSKQSKGQTHQAISKRCQLQARKSTAACISTPPPVLGRKHEPIQTDIYLEELFENPDERDVGIQTEYFLDRPTTPPSCHQKEGLDACTQTEHENLYDYDVEVHPVLEVLVGKTIEQALIEVLEEEEIAFLREQQRRFLELRAAEKAEQKRLEEQDRRLREEKDQRVRQHEKSITTQQETEERVAAAVLLTGYIAELLPAVLGSLDISGFLLDEIKADVAEDFMPWLMKEVKKEMGDIIESRKILEDIIKEVIENRAKTHIHLGNNYDHCRQTKTNYFEETCTMEENIGTRNLSNNYMD